MQSPTVDESFFTALDGPSGTNYAVPGQIICTIDLELISPHPGVSVQTLHEAFLSAPLEKDLAVYSNMSIQGYKGFYTTSSRRNLAHLDFNRTSHLRE